jgi:hypothetical protein
LAIPLSICITADQIKYGFKRQSCARSDGSQKLTELGKLIDSYPALFSSEE